MDNVQSYLSNLINDVKQRLSSSVLQPIQKDISNVGNFVGSIPKTASQYLQSAEADLPRINNAIQQDKIKVANVIDQRKNEFNQSVANFQHNVNINKVPEVYKNLKLSPTMQSILGFINSKPVQAGIKGAFPIVQASTILNPNRPAGTLGSFDPGGGITQHNNLVKQFQARTGLPADQYYRSKEAQKEMMDLAQVMAFSSAGPEIVPQTEVPTFAGNTTENVGKALTEMKGNESSIKGLLNESPAMTAARREAKLAVQDVYKGTLDDLSSAEKAVTNKAGQVIDNFENTLNNFGTDVKNKVNIVDYLRTPDRVLTKIGLGDEATALRSAWDSYQKELPVQINKISEWAKEAPTEQNNINIFQYLDGKLNEDRLLPNELKVGNEIKSYLKTFADKLGLPEDQRITNYITHIWEKGAQAKEFPEEIAKLIRNRVAGSVYDPFVEQRLGGQGYIENTWAALDAYVKRGLRKINLDPVLEQISTKAEGLEDSQYKYIKNYIDRVNLRPTDLDNLVDNFIKSTPIGYKLGPRPTAYITSTMRNWVYRGTLGLNVQSVLKNLSQGTNTYAELGEKYTAIGYSKVVQNFPEFIKNGETELERTGVLQDSFIQDRSLTSTQKITKLIDDGLYYGFNLAEKINRGASYWGAKAKGLAEGLSEDEAVNYAKDVVRKTQFTFGNIDTPVALQSDMAKTIAQLQSFTIKQGEFLGEKIASKDLAGIVRYIGANLLFAATIGKLFGFEPKDMIPTFRIGVPPTAQVLVGAGEAITGNGTGDLVNGLINYIPAGAQLKKTIQGLQSNAQGGVYSPNGQLKYPTQPSIKNAVFGPNKSDEANTYYQNPVNLSDNQTQLYKSLILSGKSPQEAYSQVTQQRQANAKLKDTQNPSLLSKIESAIGIGNDQASNNSEEPTDPLFKVTQEEAKTKVNNNLITQIFATTNSPEEAQRALNSMNIGVSYDDAKKYVIKNLDVTNRADYLAKEFTNMDTTTYDKTFKDYVDNSIITSSVVTAWEKDGLVSVEAGTAMKKYISSTNSPKSPSIKKAPALKSISIKRPAIKPLIMPKFKKIKKLKLQ